jgi:hypothetical protein
MLLLAYGDDSKALPLARIDDLQMIADAARRAIADKRQEVRQLARADRVLGVAAEGELRKLEQTLAVLLPGFLAAEARIGDAALLPTM